MLCGGRLPSLDPRRRTYASIAFDGAVGGVIASHAAQRDHYCRLCVLPLVDVVGVIVDAHAPRDHS